MAWRCSGSSNLELVQNLRQAGLIKSQQVFDAMSRVDRAHFVSSSSIASAYSDSPQPIGFGATISAPHMHAYALENLLPLISPSSRVLDVGSGSGYLCAVLYEMMGQTSLKPAVVGIDHLPGLTSASIKNIQMGDQAMALKTGAVQIIEGDGRKGYHHLAPFSVIHVGAASPTVPQALVDQLASPGRMFIPVGTYEQEIFQIDKDADGAVSQRVLFPVRYIPLCDREDQWS